MKKILILAGHYLPGHKDGGPLRTLINITEALYDEYEFYIACYDRDQGENKPYSNIHYDVWNTVGKAKVWYVPSGKFSKNIILKLAKGKDMIYMTSFFEEYGYNTLILRKEHKINLPVAIASMGVFSKEAMAHKALKKRLFINICKFFGLLKNVTWSVTSEIEASDAKRILGNNIKYIVAEDLPRTHIPDRNTHKSSMLRIVFLSRICEHKNLKVAIDAVDAMKKRDNIEFYMYGPVQEEKYWHECLEKLKYVGYKWNYGGDIASEKVQEVLSDLDVLILPSKSENYGHVIFEALSVGCIPIISDRTPWKDIDKRKVGFEVQLSKEAFTEKLDFIAEMPFDEREKISKNAICYAKEKVRNSIKNTGYRQIFG